VAKREVSMPSYARCSPGARQASGKCGASWPSRKACEPSNQLWARRPLKPLASASLPKRVRRAGRGAGTSAALALTCASPWPWCLWLRLVVRLALVVLASSCALLFALRSYFRLWLLPSPCAFTFALRPSPQLNRLLRVAACTSSPATLPPGRSFEFIAPLPAGPSEHRTWVAG
jgi:hypothetical protein